MPFRSLQVSVSVWLFVLALMFGVPTSAHAGSMALLGVGSTSGGGGGGCSQASAFLARTSGLSGTESAAYTIMICGMVSDGTWSLMDALYIFATNTTTTANLNLVSTSYGLTQSGSVTFSSDHGYTGDGSTGYLNTGFTPSTAGGNYTENAAAFGVYVLTNRTSSGSGDVEIGSTIAFNNDGQMSLALLGAETNSIINEANVSRNVFTATTTQGNWIVSRTTASAGFVYRNGSSLNTFTSTAVGIADGPVFILARNNSGSPDLFSPDQISAAFIGGALSTSQSAAVSSRINAYMTALGINVY